MPVWKHAAQREKEEELVFRGDAVRARDRRCSSARSRTPIPPNIDVLVERALLRKKFKDPITNDDFVPLPVGGALRQGPDAGPRREPAVRAARRLSHPAGIRTTPAASHRTISAATSTQPGSPAARRLRASARQARAEARRRASAASPARARINRFASTTAALTTTSGRSSTCQQHTGARRGVRHPATRVAAAAAPRRPAAGHVGRRRSPAAAARAGVRAPDRSRRPAAARPGRADSATAQPTPIQPVPSRPRGRF